MFYFGLLDSKLTEFGSQFVLLFNILAYAFAYLFLQRHILALSDLLVQAKTAFILINSVFFLSPVIHTLTKPTSGDTIMLFIVILLIIHVLTYDYTMIDEKEQKEPSSPLSFQSVVVAGILMGSRLQRLAHVFYLILFVTMYFRWLTIG